MRRRSNEAGQELVELGITILLFMVLASGVIMIGHAFLVANMITHAARDGARLAASWADRGGCQQLNNVAPIRQAVLDRIATVSTQTFTVDITQNPTVSATNPPCVNPGTTPTVAVGSAGCPNGFSVNRTVVFDDEFRG
jgi:Flp pilus assembly protein TadG